MDDSALSAQGATLLANPEENRDDLDSWSLRFMSVPPRRDTTRRC